MDGKSLTGTVVGLAVVIILAATLLMPVLNDATTTHETFDNTQYAYYQMKEIETGDSWAKTDSGWTYGDVVATTLTSGGISAVVTDDMTIRVDGLTRGVTYGSNSVTAVEAITVDEAGYLQLNGSTNIAYTAGYGVTDEGDYVLKTYDDSAYVNGDTDLWVTGYAALASVSTSQLIVHIEGTIDDGLTITAEPKYGGTVTDITVGDYTLNYEAVDGYEDLYKVTSAVFDVTGTYNDESVTTEFTYSTFVLPKEVTAELSQHLTDGENTIINMIPIILIASIVIAAVGLVVTGRRD